jgi:hypothetical protein
VRISLPRIFTHSVTRKDIHFLFCRKSPIINRICQQSQLQMASMSVTTEIAHQRRPREGGIYYNWKDGSSDWVALKDFADVLRKRNRIISKVKSQYWKTTNKLGVRLPHSVDEALRIDHATGTDFLLKAVKKEMAKVDVAFEFVEN